MTATFVLREAVVLDEGGGFDGPYDIVVEEGVIGAVEPDAPAPDGAPSFDFSGLWVMPGMVDCHVHTTVSSLDGGELLRTPITQRTLEAARNLRRTLEAGVTFVRDASGADAGVREAVARGFVAGPRLQVAVVALCQTAGHFDGFLPGPGLEVSAGYQIPDWPGRPEFRVDGIDEMRKAVRTVLRAGADWVKVCATGGVLSAHASGETPGFTFEELATAVTEARRRRRGVFVHAFGGEGLDDAVAAGVRSIEHGLYLTEEQARAMAAAGCWLVPTLSVLHDIVRWGKEGRLPAYAIPKALALEPRLGDAVAIARAAGVRIALGTDFVSRDQHGRNLEEIALAHEAGLTAEEALLAATRNGAELCGVGEHYGRIAPGYVFDAIVLDEDPSDLSVFSRPGAVHGVFKNGVAVVAHERVAALPPAP